jgi:hypothetical protein
MFAQHRDKAVKLHKRILKRCSCEEYLEEGARGITQLFSAGRRALLKNIAQPMRFIKDHQIPTAMSNIVGLDCGELVGGDHDLAFMLEGTRYTSLLGVVVELCVDDDGREGELV